MEHAGFKPHLPAGYERAAEDLAYAAAPDELLPGHRMKLLVDGDECFPAMLEAIRHAERFVHLETYIFMDDRIGKLFAEALAERVRAGIEVRVMYDGLGSMTLADEFVREMNQAGIRTVEFGPLSRWRRRRRWARRDHRKILVVDGRVGFVGGINIGDDYAPSDVGGKGWRDTHLRLEGPSVTHLERMFRSVWHQQGGEPYAAYPNVARETIASEDTDFAAVVGTDLRGRRSAIRRHYLHAISRARARVFIANAYFVPDRRIRRALCAAAERGVDVQVMVSMVSDVKAVQYAGEHTYAGLLRGGVRIQGWHEAHLHAKAAVIDGVWSTVGSYNLDYVSLFLNLEVIAEVVGRGLGAAMEAMFAADFERCQELALESWGERPWWRKALSWFFYRFRRWL